MAQGNRDTLDTWNPMVEDYEDKSFNSYDRGPGRNMPEDPQERKKYTNLYVRGVPSAVTEQGLRSLFGKHGTVMSCRTRCTPNYQTKLAFVMMETVEQCSECIRHINGHKIGNDKLFVEFAKSQEDKERHRQEREKEDALIKTLGSGRTVTNVAVGENSDLTEDLRISIANSGQCSNGSAEDYHSTGGTSQNLAQDHSNLYSKSFGSTDGKSCEQCGKAGSKYKCGKCHTAYCSPQCQSRNWGSHKDICNRKVPISPNNQNSANANLTKSSPGAIASSASPMRLRDVAETQGFYSDGLNVQDQVSKQTQLLPAVSPTEIKPATITLPHNKPIKVVLVEFQSPARFFVQLANTEDLALLNASLNQAVECSLYGIVPYKGNSWTDFSVQISTQLGLTTGQQYSITCVDATVGNQVMFSLPDGSDLGDRLIEATGALADLQSKYRICDSLHRYLKPADCVSLLVDESSVEGADTFYAQIANEGLSSFILAFQDLESQQNLYAQNADKNLEFRPRQGDFVLCEYEGSWCRGEVYQSNEQNAVVGFVDYGNLVLKPVGELLPLPRQFSHLPAIAAKIHLDGITDSQEPATKTKAASTVKELLVHSGSPMVKATVKDLNMDTLSVEIIQADGTSVSNILLSSGVVVKQEQPLEESLCISQSQANVAADSPVSPLTPPRNNQEPAVATATATKQSSPGVSAQQQSSCRSPHQQSQIQPGAPDQPRTSKRPQSAQTPSKRVVVRPLLTVGQVYTVRLRKLDATPKFCVNFPAETERVHDSLCREISRFYSQSNVPAIGKPQIGDYVVFQKSRDEWCRGYVLKVSSLNKIALTRHLDSESETTKVSFDMLREMLPQFAQAPCQAFPLCQLENIADPELKVQMLKPYMQLALQMKVVEYNDGLYIVNLTCQDEPLKSNATPKWMAGKNVEMVKLPSGPFKVTILEALSPLDIHITPAVPEDIRNCLQVVAEQGEKVRSSQPPAAVEPGEVLLLFAQQYKEWDRVIVLENLEGGKVAVKSAEFGTIYTEFLRNLRVLTAEGAKEPIRAVKCSLEGVGQTVTDDACDYISKLKDSVVTAEIVQDTPDNITCKIYANGVDVNGVVNTLMPDVASIEQQVSTAPPAAGVAATPPPLATAPLATTPPQISTNTSAALTAAASTEDQRLARLEDLLLSLQQEVKSLRAEKTDLLRERELVH